MNRQLTGDCLGYSREGFRNVLFRQLFGAVAPRVHVSGLPILNCAVCGHRRISVHTWREVARAKAWSGVWLKTDCPDFYQNNRNKAEALRWD